MTERFAHITEILAASRSRFGQERAFGQRTAAGWSWVNFEQFALRVERVATGLRSLGIGPTDRVALLSDNCLPWAECCYAVARVGAVLVPMYPAQRPSDWEFILRDSEAKLVLAGSPESERGLDGLLPDLPKPPVVATFQPPTTGALSYEELGRVSESGVMAAADPEALAALIYTSGTTGHPKGVMLSHRNIASNVASVRTLFPLGSADCSLSFLPWAHAFGQTGELHTLVSLGVGIAINDDLSRLVDNLGEVRPTVLVAVPRVFDRIHGRVESKIAGRPAPIRRLYASALDAARRGRLGEPLSWRQRATVALAERLIFAKVRRSLGGRLRYAFSGSAALGREVAEFIATLGVEVFEGYGLTEASPVVSANCPGQTRAGSVGRPVPGVRVEIEALAEGGSVGGQLVVYGPNVMRGYHRHPSETASAIGQDGGLRTGDLGHVDEAGFVYITGRIKEQFKLSNGKYIAPAPLEEALKLSELFQHVLLSGANRPHSVALVVIEPVAVERWAARERICLPLDPCSSEPLRSLVRSEIERRSHEFKNYEKPKAFAVISGEFSVENGMLTPTLKLKRRRVLEKYGPLLESLY